VDVVALLIAVAPLAPWRMNPRLLVGVPSQAVPL